MTALPTPINAAWNVVWDSKNNCTSDAKGIHVTLDKNGFASKAGAHFRAAPKGVFPARAATLSYKVFFPADFDFVKGGKLPGLWGGAPGAGGGDWNDDGYSLRVMFREGGEAVGYAYMCTDQGAYDGDERCALVRNQGRGFADIAHHTNGAGIDLWRAGKDDRGMHMKFTRGAWNAVSLTLGVNARGAAAASNGVAALTVNGVTRRFEGVRWCAKGDMPVSGIAFSVWMGGGNDSYAPSKTQKIDIKDVSVTL